MTARITSSGLFRGFSTYHVGLAWVMATGSLEAATAVAKALVVVVALNSPHLVLLALRSARRHHVVVDVCDSVIDTVRIAMSAGRPLQAVITWENLPDQPIYRIPPYRQAVASCRDADLLLCMVDAARDHLLANGFDDARIKVVKPGVETTLFTPGERPAQAPRVVFTSPLAPNKGIDRVLAAMALVRREIPEAELVVAGGGPLRPLVAQAAADPAQHVTLLDNLDAHGVADTLRGAAVFCTAPRPTWKWTEQLGLAYLEAQSCGLPVVTTRCGTNDEAVHAPNLLVDDDVEALAEALLTFLRDPELRARVGAANRARMLAEHDLPTQCARMGAAFAEVEAAHR